MSGKVSRKEVMRRLGVAMNAKAEGVNVEVEGVGLNITTIRAGEAPALDFVSGVKWRLIDYGWPTEEEVGQSELDALKAFLTQTYFERPPDLAPDEWTPDPLGPKLIAVVDSIITEIAGNN